MNRFDPYENTSGPLDNYRDSLELQNEPLNNYSDPMTRVDPFADNPGLFNEIINWSHDPMNKPQNQNKYFFSDGKTYYEQICKMLKLMAVFKNAFNQIYDNEDEIHEAWENFVDNLSATAEYGEEVGVTLTWTEESVNFDFTIPGGTDGTGIQSIVFNADYTMTITLTDGTSYTSPSLKGETGATGATGPQGPTGPRGPQGEGLNILDVYPTLADLQTAHPTGQPGDAYEVGSEPTFILYIWSSSQNAWVSAGSLGSVAPSDTNPLMDGTASPGISDYYSRGDHVHPTDTSRASASDLNTLSGTVSGLSSDLGTLSGTVSNLGTTVTGLSGDITALDGRVDNLEDVVINGTDLTNQEFLYRETPVDHDTIARINSIKGNTISFNQLVQNGNFVNSDNWLSIASVNLNISNNEATITTSSNDGIKQNFNSIVGHKYYLSLYAKEITNLCDLRFAFRTSSAGYSDIKLNALNVYEKKQAIITCLRSEILIEIFPNVAYSDYQFSIKNVMIFDLTLMGIDNLTTTAEVEQWLSTHIGNLPYYDYTQGTLIPFMGTGLKATGKNLYPKTTISSQTINGVTLTVNPDGSIATSGQASPQVYVQLGNVVLKKGSYIVSCGATNGNQAYCTLRKASDDSYIANVFGDITYTATEDIEVRISLTVANGYTTSITLYPMIRLADVQDNTFEPYQTNTLSLPISTYFPTGMKSAGSVYDELTPSKATTRIGYIKVEELSSTGGTRTNGDFYTALSGFNDAKPTTNTDVGNAVCNICKTMSASARFSSTESAIVVRNSGAIEICIAGISTYNELQTYVNTHDIYIVYEKNTPTETSISPELDLTYPVWNGGTEQILPENTSTPITAPIIADFTYMSTDEAIQYLYDHISASVQAELDDLDERVTDTETAISSMQTDISDLQTDLSTLYVIEEHDYGFGNFPANHSIPYTGTLHTVTGYKPVGIVGNKIYRVSDSVAYDANGMILQYDFCNLANNLMMYNITNTTSSVIENVRLTLYVLYIKDNGGN